MIHHTHPSPNDPHRKPTSKGPKSAPIKSVTVNGPSTNSGQGQPWTEFNKDKETITLKGLTGTVAVTAQY